MPFATSESRLSAGSRGVSSAPRLRTRLLASLHRGALDLRIADGENVSGDRELEARAWQLTRRHKREVLATALETIVADVERPPARRGVSVPVCRHEVEVARAEMVQIAERLSDPFPVQARGVLLVRQLLRDGDSPLFILSRTDELWHRMRRAADALG